MPTSASSGVISPGQFGPIIFVPFFFKYGITRTMSSVGMPSVMAITSSIPASDASRILSAATAAGTKMIDVLAPVAFTASVTVSKTGIPSTSCPPLPGETPATTFVPYAFIFKV